MYAIIRVGGHQEKVQPGERILIDRVKTDVGGTVDLKPLMVSGDEGEAVTDHAELTSKAAVVGTVVEHIRGDKIDASRYQSKTGFRKQWGHRQALTVVEITEIRLGEKTVTGEAANAEAAVKREADQKAAAEARDAARAKRDEAKAAKKKPAPAAAAKKAVAAKKAPAKKTAAKKTAAKKAAPKKKA